MDTADVKNGVFAEGLIAYMFDSVTSGTVLPATMASSMQLAKQHGFCHAYTCAHMPAAHVSAEQRTQCCDMQQCGAGSQALRKCNIMLNVLTSFARHYLPAAQQPDALLAQALDECSAAESIRATVGNVLGVT